MTSPHFYYPHADEVGGALRLAHAIKGNETLSLDSVMAVGTRLGLKPAETKNTAIAVMEELGWIDPQKGPDGRINRLRVNVPIVGDAFGQAGKLFLEREPRPIEIAGVSSLSEVARCPMPREDLLSLSQTKEEDLGIAIEQGKAARFLDEYRFGSQQVVFSPYLWNTPSIDALKTIAELPEVDRHSVNLLATTVSRHPGVPLELLKARIGARNIDSIVAQATQSGLISRTRIDTVAAGPHEFVFLPSRKLRIPLEGEVRGDAFDRVKQIISCVRQGEHYGAKTRIKYPAVILRSLLDNGYIGKKPQRDIKDQYAILEPWLGTAARAYGERYTFQFNRTPENEQIVRLAIEAISDPEVGTGSLDPADAETLVGSGTSFSGPEHARIRNSLSSPIAAGQMRLLEIIRGERHDEY
ncbi:MAG: hypothetical protein HYT80_08930 [Euryarchaeota archaeon]|nr:hypothetical protein [Euryarchaeota archaeon]